MTKKNVDLSKLRKEIDSRKQEQVTQKQKTEHAPKDSFLNELLTSLKTGQPTNSSKRVKMVEQKAAEKTGEVNKNSSGNETMVDAIGKHSGNQNSTQMPSEPQITGDDDRDNLLYEEYNRKMEEMFGKGAKNVMQPHQPNQTQNQLTSQPKQQLNEEYLVGTVKKILNENFAPMVEEAMKDAIVEIYSVEKIKEVIQENESLIKGIVINTIRELQKKKKPQ